MKSFTRLLLTVLVALASSPSASAHDFEAVNANGKTIYYKILMNYKCAVTYRGQEYWGDDKWYEGDIAIPSSVEFNGKTYTVASIGDRAFYECSKVTSVVIPNSVTEICDNAFYGCTGLASVNIPNSVTAFGDWVFYGCSSLETVDYGNSLTSIGNSAFSGCGKLKSGNLPFSLVSIGQQAFNSCSSLSTVVFGKNVEYIGDVAFQSCEGLEEIISFNTTPPICGYGAFTCWAVSKKRILKVPAQSVEAYGAIYNWSEFGQIVPISKIDLYDDDTYTNNETIKNSIATYTRNFNNTSWQALYIPFPMKYEDWADKADVAYINNVHQWDDDNDGEIDRTVLEFITKKSGSIEANKPYVIRPKQTGEVTFTNENTILYAAPETDGYVDCMSTTTKYTLYGTYQEKTDMYANGYYAMADGDFKQAESANVTLAPFRTYLKIESRTGAGTVQQAKRINIMVDGVMDNDATGIGEIAQKTSLETQNCYNLSGQKVNSNYKGIAIKNGKKYIIK